MLEDLITIAYWWILFLFLGSIGFVYAALVFKGSVDLGYAFAKTITLLLLTYLIFISATLKIFPFNNTAIWLVLAIFGIVSILLGRKNKNYLKKNLKSSWQIIVGEEMMFLATLIFWSLIRGFQPDIRGLEKFMDVGFINALLNIKYLPPPDMWQAGAQINYYYFGHLAAAILTKISYLPSAIAYNLLVATLFATVFLGAFSLVFSLLNKTGIKKAVVGGIIASFLTTLGGNLHTLVYGIKNGFEKYWYPDATRFIGYNPPTDDKTIHEFPSYSFVVSDLHAHLLNLPFVFLFLGLLLHFWMQTKKDKKNISLYSIIFGFLLGVFIMTNSWDFVSYFVLLNMASFIIAIQSWGFKRAVLLVLSSGSIAITTALLVSTPFLINFSPMTKGVFPVHSHTPLWQLAILWGAPAVFTAVFLLSLKKSVKQDLITASLLTAGWLLVALPEVIYFKDIYTPTYYRANTMFKFTYQAFIWFSLSMGYIMIKQAEIKNKILQTTSVLLTTVLFFSVMLYPFFAIKSYYNGLRKYHGLDGQQWLKTTYPENFSVILWLKNLKNKPRILEAVGESYSDYNHISAYTGLPTVQGWTVHEWLWRGNYETVQKRAEDVRLIYETENPTLALNLLKKYGINIVIVSRLEREKYPHLTEIKFLTIGKLVFQSGNTKVYRIY